MATPPLILIVLTWIWSWLLMHPELPNLNPLEVIAAAKAFTACAAKWSAVADAILSWHMPVAFLAGLAAGWLWGRRASA